MSTDRWGGGVIGGVKDDRGGGIEDVIGGVKDVIRGIEDVRNIRVKICHAFDN